MAVCTSPTCLLAKAKTPQYGAKCMKCGSPLEATAPIQFVTTTTTSGPPLTDGDWKDAARWALAIDPGYRADWGTRSRVESEAVVRKYWAKYDSGTPDDDDVRGLAKKARDRAEGLGLIDGWAEFVVKTL